MLRVSTIICSILLFSVTTTKFVPSFPSNYLKEYSVIYTDRTVNLMSEYFQKAMKDLISDLKTVYNASNVALIPGSGTMGMEAVHRQFATNKPALVIRNGYFSYRWSQIDEFDNITDKLTVIKAHLNPLTLKVSPPPIEEIVAKIIELKPSVIFMPHVETSVGVLLSDTYIRTISEAAGQVGALQVLDGIASGSIWVDMKYLGVDVYVSAPQKSWTAPAGVGIVMLGDRAMKVLETTTSTSFSLDLKKWVSISDAYKNGGFAYHTTPPSDVIMAFRDTVKETLVFGLQRAKDVQLEMGNQFRKMLEEFGFESVAEDGWRSPTVIVSYCKENMVPLFVNKGIQVAGKVPFMIDEPTDIITFRIGLFGLDKLANPQKTLAVFRKALEEIVMDAGGYVQDKL